MSRNVILFSFEFCLSFRLLAAQNTFSLELLQRCCTKWLWSATFVFCLFGLFNFIYLVILFIFVVLGLELKAYILSHSISPFFCDGSFLK
jgi:hypothetical protein